MARVGPQRHRKQTKTNSFLLEAESTPGSQRGRKDYNDKLQRQKKELILKTTDKASRHRSVSVMCMKPQVQTTSGPAQLQTESTTANQMRGVTAAKQTDLPPLAGNTKHEIHR